jgi:hypothetical protein
VHLSLIHPGLETTSYTPPHKNRITTFYSYPPSTPHLQPSLLSSPPFPRHVDGADTERRECRKQFDCGESGAGARELQSAHREAPHETFREGQRPDSAGYLRLRLFLAHYILCVFLPIGL